MPYRTNPAAVQAVLLPGGDYDKKKKPDITPFIRPANMLVNRINTADASGSIADDELKEIETWLAAFFYCTSDQPYSYKTTASAQGTFQGKTGMYFEGNKYGQMAVLLDSTGTLKAIQDGNIGTDANAVPSKVPSMTWLGKRPSRRTHYYDRY